MQRFLHHSHAVRSQYFFVCGRDILRAVSGENRPRALHPFRIIGVNREKNSSGLHTVRIACRVIFGKPHANQGADDPTSRRADTGSGKKAQDRPRRNKCAQPRNAERGETRDHSQRRADLDPDSRASPRISTRVARLSGMFFFGQLRREVMILRKDRDVVAPETRSPQSVNTNFCLRTVVKDSEHRSFFLRHSRPPSIFQVRKST